MSTTFNHKLNQKKRRIYILLFLSTITTFVIVIGFNYYLVEIRGAGGSLFYEVSKQRSDTQILITTYIEAIESDSVLNITTEKTASWMEGNAVFLATLYEKNKKSESIDLLNEAIASMEKEAARIQAIVSQISNQEIPKSSLVKAFKHLDTYLDNLNTLSRINFVTYSNDINSLIIKVTLIVLISLLGFVYLFIFQIRPLFNQIVHKNEELRNISSKQSHIYRAPLANILGLLYLIDNAETTDEILAYVRLIKLNAEAMDERIHKVVEHAERVQDFDGTTTDNLNSLIVMEKEQLI